MVSGVAAFVRHSTLAALLHADRSINPAPCPPLPELPALRQRLHAGEASVDERAQFATLWQMRVKRILIDHFDDPRLAVIAEA